MRIALVGYGRMGKSIEKAAQAVGHSISGRAQAGWELDDLGRCDVAIEFSTPEAAWSNVQRLLKSGIPTVCGTTGWDAERVQAEELCQKTGGAFLYASNFSTGVNLFFALNRILAKWMADHPEYVPEIEETHHVHKKDAPSGTAVRLAEDLLQQRNDKEGWSMQPNAKSALKVIAHRLDEVPGTHEVRYTCATDDLRIEHVSKGREAFARGAVRAAEWLQGKQGCFGMNDVLELHSLQP